MVKIFLTFYVNLLYEIKEICTNSYSKLNGICMENFNVYQRKVVNVTLILIKILYCIGINPDWFRIAAIY